MIKFLFYKIIYKFHRINFYICSVVYYYQNNLYNENKVKRFFKGLFDNLKIFNYKYGYYEYLEIPITTKCSLKCKNCSNLIPCYNKPSDAEDKTLIKSIESFLECINSIVYIRILGGEPFMAKNLNKVLETLIKSNKILRIEVVTNGTIIPTDKTLIKNLQHKRVAVSISDYPMVDNTKLISFLKDNNIKYRLDSMAYWVDYGRPYKRNKTKKELIRQYAICDHICKSLLNGQVHMCPRSSHGVDLGIIKGNEDDYLDVLDPKLTPIEKREKLNKILKKKYIIACDYCDFATKNSKRIPVAEQLEKKKKN